MKKSNYYLNAFFFGSMAVGFIYFITFFIIGLFNCTPEQIERTLFGAVMYFIFANLWKPIK